MKRVSQYDVVSRYLWLWVSGMMASNAGWAFTSELYNAATLFAAFSGVLVFLFLGVKPRPVEEKATHDRNL